MINSLQRRLQAALEASAARETADYCLFNVWTDEHGEEQFILLATGDELNTEAFLALVESKTDTAFVALSTSREVDEEFAAYMEEPGHWGPSSLAEMKEENAAVGDPAKLAELETRYQARRDAAAKTKRAELARRYGQRVETWQSFMDEMQDRVDRNRERRQGRRAA